MSVQFIRSITRPAAQTRADQVLEIVKEVLVEYRDLLNSGADIRAINIDVRMRADGQGARCAIVTLQGEMAFTVRPS